MGCTLCAKLNKKEKDLVKIYREYYTKYGKDYYVFKTSAKGDIKIVNKKQFKTVFETQIKPNFDKGAEYGHIKEYIG